MPPSKPNSTASRYGFQVQAGPAGLADPEARVVDQRAFLALDHSAAAEADVIAVSVVVVLFVVQGPLCAQLLVQGLGVVVQPRGRPARAPVRCQPGLARGLARRRLRPGFGAHFANVGGSPGRVDVGAGVALPLVHPRLLGPLGGPSGPRTRIPYRRGRFGWLLETVVDLVRKRRRPPAEVVTDDIFLA